MIFRRVAPALLIALFALALPSVAAAAAYVVDNTGDLPSGPGAACGEGEGCSLRAAIEAANEDSVKDAIGFDATVFKGDAGSTIEPGSPLPEILQPAALGGGTCVASGGEVPCVTIKGIFGFATLSVKANESAVEYLNFEGGGVGIRVQALGGSGPGVEVLENTFTGAGNAISSVGTIGGSGNLIEGNVIDVPAGFNFGITISNGPNQVYGNVIDGEGCCYTGIWLEGTASGNRIGGDTEASENVINGFQNGAITLILPESTRNEIGRNRGENGARFINLGPTSANGGILPPAFGIALQSRASGTAQPGAKIRVFRKATEGAGEIASFLGEAVADSTGTWEVTYPPVPEGTLITATQTVEGGTSELADPATVSKPESVIVCSPSSPAGICWPPKPPVSPETTPPPAVPNTQIVKGPKKRSAGTKAKFTFKATVDGATFECKLDRKAFRKCKSPKTYKNLKPGKHVFRVRAVGPTGLVDPTPAKRRFTVLG